MLLHFCWLHRAFSVRRLWIHIIYILFECRSLEILKKNKPLLLSKIFFPLVKVTFPQSISLYIKWFSDKSTLWWAAPAHHTSSVKYCLINNQAHMFPNATSWFICRLCSFFYILNFLKIRSPSYCILKHNKNPANDVSLNYKVQCITKWSILQPWC